MAIKKSFKFTVLFALIAVLIVVKVAFFPSKDEVKKDLATTSKDSVGVVAPSTTPSYTQPANAVTVQESVSSQSTKENVATETASVKNTSVKHKAKEESGNKEKVDKKNTEKKKKSEDRENLNVSY